MNSEISSKILCQLPYFFSTLDVRLLSLKSLGDCLAFIFYFLIPGKEKIRNFKSCFSEKVHLYLQRKVHLYLQRIPLSSNVHSCLTAQKQTRPHLTGREQREQSIHFLVLLIEESKRESDWLGNSLCSFILPYVGRAYCV